MPKKSSKPTVADQLTAARERERRVLADYQNLIRRTQEDRVKFAQLANRDLVAALIQPLEHLELAAAQLSDTGLEMALDQLKRTLKDFGLEEIEVLGQPFDVATMEAVEGSSEGKVVKQIVRKGYRLNGAVIQHAKVLLG